MPRLAYPATIVHPASRGYLRLDIGQDGTWWCAPASGTPPVQELAEFERTVLDRVTPRLADALYGDRAGTADEHTWDPFERQVRRLARRQALTDYRLPATTRIMLQTAALPIAGLVFLAVRPHTSLWWSGLSGLGVLLVAAWPTPSGRAPLRSARQWTPPPVRFDAAGLQALSYDLAVGVPHLAGLPPSRMPELLFGFGGLVGVWTLLSLFFLGTGHPVPTIALATPSILLPAPGFRVIVADAALPSAVDFDAHLIDRRFYGTLPNGAHVRIQADRRARKLLSSTPQ